jgi:hypothetical protein
MVGAPGPFDYITMGGMFTVLKVRDGLTNYNDRAGISIPQERSLKQLPPKICDAIASKLN